MQSKLKFTFLLLAASVFVFSCTKNNDAPVTPPAPELFDTLGAGWQRIKLDTTLDFEDIFFVNNQTGFLCGKNYLGKSTDGGLSWKKCIPDSLNDSFVNLYFADASNGWAFGGSHFFLRTKDGGTSWQKINRGGVFDGQFFDANSGYVTVNPGGLNKTADGGVTLQSAGNISPLGLFFLNQNKGWVSGSYLYKTEDGGLSFSHTPDVFPGPGGGEYVIQFIDALHGWVAGVSGIFRTVDGGVSLENLLPGIFYDSGDIHFFDANNGFILRGNYIYSTTDGGTTLSKICTIHKSPVYEIHFTDLNHGWTAGHGGYVYRYVKP